MNSTEADMVTFDELPDDARALVTETERAVEALRENAHRRVAAIRAEADAEAEAIHAQAATQIAAVQQETTQQLAPLVRQLVDSLRALQERYCRDGKLDEALAVRSRVRQLRGDLLGVRGDPGNLTAYGPDQIGRSYLFEVTGHTDGSVWGTDVYTADSRLCAVAVHAGAIRDGERGLVRATIQDGADVVYAGSLRHGVASYDYANYPVAYRVERV